MGCGERFLPGTSKWIAALHIARLAIAANQYLIAAILAEAAPNLARPPPDQLSVMRDVLRPARSAVRGEDAGDEILFFGDPEIDHRFRTEGAGRPAPDILAFERATGNIRRMFEASGRRQMVSPGLCALGQLVVPAKGGDANQRAFAIVAVEEAVVEAAKPWLGSGKQRCRCCEKSELARHFDEPLHTKPLRRTGTVAPGALRQGGTIWLTVG